MFKYYAEFYDEEHYALASEIAEFYGIYSSSGKPHSSLVTAVIDDYLSENGRAGERIFYSSKKAMLRVYPSKVYKASIRKLYNEASKSVYLSSKGIKYSYKIINK